MEEQPGAVSVEHVGTTSTSTKTRTGRPPLAFKLEFIKTIPGILKIAELAMSMATFICAAVWGGAPAGWVMFVSMSSFILCLIIFVFHLTNMIYKVPRYRLLIWLIYYGLYSLFYVIASCVAVGYAAQSGSSSACEATAVFSCFTTPIFCYDAWRQYQGWRNDEDDIVVTTTTVTMTSVTPDQARAAVY